MRTLTYAQAIREAHAQMLALDARVFVIGQGLWSPWYAGSSLEGLDREFGPGRMVDSPVSENAVTGMAIGAALAGLRPIVFHPRMDFMLLAMDPIVNQAANWSYLFGSKSGVPLVIRAVINRGGEQGAQHSQARQGISFEESKARSPRIAYKEVASRLGRICPLPEHLSDLPDARHVFLVRFPRSDVPKDGHRRQVVVHGG